MSTYFDQIRSVVRYVDKAKPGRKWCVMYQDDDVGQEVLQGTEAALKALGKALVDKTIGAVMKSGEIDKIYAKWFTSPIPPKGINMNFPQTAPIKDAFKNPNDKGV